MAEQNVLLYGVLRCGSGVDYVGKSIPVVNCAPCGSIQFMHGIRAAVW